MKSEKIVDALDYLPDEMLYETDRIRQKKPLKWWKPLTAVAACLVVVFVAMIIFAATGAESADKATMEMGSSMNRAPGEMKDDSIADGMSGGTAEVPMPENRKLIRTVTMEAETETMDTLITALEEKIAQLQGYVEMRESHNGNMGNLRRSRYVDMTIRIPADKLEEFLTHVGNSAHIVSTNEAVDDITLTYVATESHMNALKTEEERLLELMKQAKDMSDLLKIEQRLTEVRYDLERITSQLMVYDNQVDYSTVNLTVSEVREYTEVTEPVTVWERITTGFGDSLESLGEFFVNLFVFIIVALPYLLVIGVVTLVVILIVRKKRKK